MSIVVFSRLRCALSTTRFPYTTLFRSKEGAGMGDNLRFLWVVISITGGIVGLTKVFGHYKTGWGGWWRLVEVREGPLDRKSTRLNSSHRCISYAVFCLKKKKITSSLYS